MRKNTFFSLENHQQMINNIVEKFLSINIIKLKYFPLNKFQFFIILSFFSFHLSKKGLSIIAGFFLAEIDNSMVWNHSGIKYRNNEFNVRVGGMFSFRVLLCKRVNVEMLM